jgi:pimeloyl-ACP methyl ester carboxylesterase
VSFPASAVDKRRKRRTLDEHPEAEDSARKGEAGQGAYLGKIEQWSDGDVGDLKPLLPRIRVAVRLIWGLEDRWLEPSVAQRLNEMIPRSDYGGYPKLVTSRPKMTPTRLRGNSTMH